jgi:cation:H+ antiporter
LSTAVEFVVALVAIILGAAFFTNAIEILGGRLGLRQGAVGSLLAAVGTALPESMIAIFAILEPVLTGEASEEGASIGIGAILGAPFMLATLAMFVVGVSALFFRRHRDQGTRLRVDASTVGRDVGFFLVFFAVAAGVGLVELPLYTKVVVALVLAFGYGLYVRRTLFSGEHLEEVPKKLLLMPRRQEPPLFAVVFQTRGEAQGNGLRGLRARFRHTQGHPARRPEHRQPPLQAAPQARGSPNYPLARSQAHLRHPAARSGRPPETGPAPSGARLHNNDPR